MRKRGSNAPRWPEELKKGYLKLLILASLARRPMHGYEIMREAAERTLGLWKPTAGGTYPLLGKMEREGWIRGEWRISRGRRRKVYGITSKGEAKLKRILEIHGIVLRIAHKIHSELEEGASEGAALEEMDRMLTLLKAQLRPEGLKGLNEGERARILRLLRDRLERIEKGAREAIEGIDEAMRGLRAT
ncbi:MAG: PadR family transcriptional regulator [Candidatus Bathyarchaeia archaeon]